MNIPSFALRSEEQATALSIETLVAQTLSENPELKFYEAEIVAAKAARSAAGRLPNPELDLDLGRKAVRSSDTSASGVAWAAALAQPIEWPGRLGLRKAIANRDIALAELGLARFKTALAGKVRSLAYGLALQQERTAAVTEVQNRLTALKDVIVQRDPAGVTPLLETKVIEATAVVVQKQAADAEIEMQKALLELNQLRGRRATTPLVVRRTDFTFPAYGTADELLAEAAQNNYEIRVRVRELEQQGLKVALSKNERFPTFTVGPTLSRESAGETETVAGIALSVPLPIWNTGKANVTAAQARLVQGQASLLSTQREIERQVTEAAMLYQTHQQRLKAWKPDTLKSFREVAALADRHYRLGAVEVATYVELQEKYLEALEAINETNAAAVEAALNLEQLVGITDALVRSSEAEASAKKSPKTRSASSTRVSNP
ncbi:MAG: TolC family protein [Verrucomicrobiales bacterium]